MRYVIYGAGAIGGVIGGRLAQHGRDVVLIARGGHLAAIQRAGLVLESPVERVTLPIPAVGSPAEVDWREGDAVVLAMKTQDTEAALNQLALVAPASTPIVCAQNGVENERLVLRRFANVYAQAVMLPATHLEPGVVQANSGSAITGVLDTGRYPAGSDPFAERFTADLEASGFSSKPDPAVMRKKYAKLLMNLGNAYQAACADQADREVTTEARAEAVACYQAAGIDFASEEEDRARRGDLIRVMPIAGQRRSGGSSWQSLARGHRTIEADYLNGEIVMLGALHGVPTPVNRVLQRVANRLAAAGAAPGAMTLAELKAEIDAERRGAPAAAR
ncbi:MAG: 2-dehydropantoate 2-reductase N-terminal domain-containing protein [Dehalococcoidia bacterium]